MLQKLIEFKDNKWSWIVLAIIPIFLICSALFFQHGLGLEPCVLCIYQRIATIGIFIAALIPLIFKLHNKIAKCIAYLLWIVSSSYGLWAAGFQWYETYQSRANPFFMSQCGQGLEAYFPFLLDYEILTKLFVARGICTDIDWMFLGLEMHHWMTLFFSCFLVSGIFYSLVSLVQSIKGKKDV